MHEYEKQTEYLVETGIVLSCTRRADTAGLGAPALWSIPRIIPHSACRAALCASFVASLVSFHLHTLALADTLRRAQPSCMADSLCRLRMAALPDAPGLDLRCLGVLPHAPCP